MNKKTVVTKRAETGGAFATKWRHGNSLGRKPQVDHQPDFSSHEVATRAVTCRHSVAESPSWTFNLGLTPQAIKFRHAVAAREYRLYLPSQALLKAKLLEWTRDAERAE